MSESEFIDAGTPLPRIASAAASGPASVKVRWAEGARGRSEETIDLAPEIYAYRVYRPLRDDPALFRTVHPIEHGAAIAWGQNHAIDMAAATLERLAAEQMTAADFSEFLARNRLTYEAAAARLGISRRLVAYYASGRPIPRHIVLACRYLEAARAA